MIGLAIAGWLTSAVDAAAQRPQNGRANRPRANAPAPQLPPDTGAGVSPAEIQRLFDAYVVMQAQRELELTDEQYPPFLTRVRALQDTRRRADVERTRRIQVLRRLTNDRAASDDDIRGQLRELRGFNERVNSEIARAEEAVAQLLTVRQQARYHLFQEMMERRKIDLLTRARQANRARPPQ